MTSDDFKTYFTIGLAVWNVCLTLAVWLRKPGEDAAQAVQSLREEVARIQTELEHVPTSQELEQIKGTVGQINERTQLMAESARATAAALYRIETYLLNNK